jgi:hypothetical protein
MIKFLIEYLKTLAFILKLVLFVFGFVFAIFGPLCLVIYFVSYWWFLGYILTIPLFIVLNNIKDI